MKKKICFVVSRPGTAVSFFKTPMEKLKGEFDVYLVANIASAEEIADLPLVGYKSIKIERRLNICADVKALWHLYNYFRQEKFYVVHSMASKPSLLMSIAGAMACITHRIRTFTGQIWCNMHGLKRFLFKCVDRITVALNTELLADGFPQARYLIEQKILKPSQIKVLANGSICGIDTERFHYDEKVRGLVRKELGVEEKVVYVFLGRLKREKGIWELFEAFNNVVTKCPKAHLLLVGKDEERCQSWIKGFPNLKENSNITFYGYTSRPNDILMASDVFCMPSYREGFGLSVLEASCLGLPVICSDIYGMEDTFVEGVTGLRCKVQDDITLAECILKLYDQPELREKLGKNGHDRVVKDFSRELVTNAWFDFYKELK